MIRFACPGCRAGLEVAEELGGTLLQCPTCGRSLPVPTLLVPGVVPPGSTIVAAGSPPPGVRRESRLSWTFRRSPVFARSWRRLASPSALLLALLLFPLPWIEVRCDRPIADTGSRVLASQSGFQAAYGGYSENSLVREVRAGRARVQLPAHFRDQDIKLQPSPWMILFPALLLAGILASFAIGKPFLRQVLVLASSALAGAVLLFQWRNGFPLEHAFPNTVTGEVAFGGVLKVEASAPTSLEIHSTVWLWLTLAAVLTAIALAMAEAWESKRPRPSPSG
jgi:hypothetical protein